MVRLLLTMALIVFSFIGQAQALIGLTSQEIKKTFKAKQPESTFVGAKLQDGDSLLVVETDFYDAYCNINGYTHKVDVYILLPNKTEFLRAYVKALDEKHHRISDRKWVTSDYSVSIEYTWLAEYADYGFIIKLR